MGVLSGKQEKGLVGNADKILSLFIDPGVKYWIRTEYIETDLIKAFSPYLDIKYNVSKEDFLEKINVTNSASNIMDWFTKEEIKVLYNSCPLWTELELELYGNLLDKY
jgi:hypothetical protein